MDIDPFGGVTVKIAGELVNVPATAATTVPGTLKFPGFVRYRDAVNEPYSVAFERSIRYWTPICETLALNSVVALHSMYGAAEAKRLGRASSPLPEGEKHEDVFVKMAVDVGVGVGVSEGFGVGVRVGTAVGVGDGVGVAVALAVGVPVAVGVGVDVATGVGVALLRIGCTGAPEPEPPHDVRVIDKRPTATNGAPRRAGKTRFFPVDGKVSSFGLRLGADMRLA